MARVKIKIDELTRKFANKLKADFKPAKIILFGNRATEDFWNYSDYDFIIISDKFEKVHWRDRINNITMHWNSDKPLIFFPYTKKEFYAKKKTSVVVKEAVKKGIVI